MAASGAKVLMLRAVELARNQDVPHPRALDVLGRGRARGSRTSRGSSSRSSPRSRTRRTRSLFDLRGVPDRPGIRRRDLRRRRRRSTSTSTRSSRTSGTDSAELSFSVPQDDVPATRRALERAQESIGSIEVEEIADLGKVSLVGAGHALAPGRRRTHVPHARRRGDQPPADLDVSDQGLVPDRPRGRRASGSRAPRRVLARRRARGSRRVGSPPMSAETDGIARRADSRPGPRPHDRGLGRARHRRAPAAPLRRSRSGSTASRSTPSVFTDTSERAPRQRRDPKRRRDARRRRAVRERRRAGGGRGAAARATTSRSPGRRRQALRQASYQIVDRALEQPAFQKLFTVVARGVAHDARRRCSRAAAIARVDRGRRGHARPAGRSSARPPTGSASASRSRTRSPPTPGRS